MLGDTFSVADVAVITGRSPYELVGAFDEAIVAHVVVNADTDLAFRHPFLRRALYDGIPRSLRSSLYRHAAQALYRSGVPVSRWAEQGDRAFHASATSSSRPRDIDRRP